MIKLADSSISVFLIGPVLLFFLIFTFLTAINPFIGLAMILCALLALWAFFNTEQLMRVVLFLIPLGSLTVIFPPTIAGGQGVTFLSTLTVTKIVILFIVLAYSVKSIVLKSGRLFQSMGSNNIFITVCLYFVCSIISVVNAKNIEIFIFYEIRLLNLLILVFLVSNLISEKKDLVKTLIAFVFSYLIVGLIGLYEIISQSHFLELIDYPIKEQPYSMGSTTFRAIGPSGDPDFFAISTIFGLFITMTIIFRPCRKLYKTILFIFIAIFLLIIFGTGSRGAILALIFGIIVFFILIEIRHKFIVVGLTLALFGFLFLMYTFAISELTFGRYTGETGSKSLIYRIGWTKMAFNMIAEDPIIGIGTYNFIEEYNRYIVPEVPREKHMLHNTFLQVWAENGALGILFYVIIYIVSFYNLIKSYLLTKGSRDNVIPTSFISLFVAMVVFGITSNVLVNELYWVVFAISYVTLQVYQKKITSIPSTIHFK